MLVAVLSLTLGLGAFTGAFAAELDLTVPGPVTMDMATMGIGSAWFAYGPILAELIARELPAGSVVNVIPAAGAVANPILVSRGEFPIAVGFNQSNFWAYNGMLIYDEPFDNLRGLVGYLDTFFYVAAVSRAFGVTDLAEVAERRLPMRVSVLPPGTLGEVVTRLVFQHYGFTYDDIRSWGGRVEHNDWSTIVDLFRDGQTDFFMHNVTQGHAALTELAIATDISFLRFPEEMIEAFARDFGFSRELLPANSFRGQTEDIPSMGLTSTLFASADLPDGIAYTIARALVENTEAMHLGHIALSRFTPESAARTTGMGLPLHPGAEAFYRGAGLLE